MKRERVDLSPRRKLLALLFPITVIIIMAASPAALKLVKAQQLDEQGSSALNLNEADEYGIYLLGFFDIHRSHTKFPFKCGPIETDNGYQSSRKPMQNLEAFLWAIDQVNEDKSLLPGVKLGSLVLDSCSSFLKTNQQLANLLHPNHHSEQGHGSPMPSARQFAGLVADNYDLQTIDSVVTMASSSGLSTFVTQSRSTKLNELIKRFKQSATQATKEENSFDPDSANHSIHINQNQDSLQKRSSMASSSASENQRKLKFDSLLEDLLGNVNVGQMLPSNLMLPDPEASDMGAANGSSTADNQHDGLYMVKMALNNEIVADCLATLCQQMSWDLVSLVYDSGHNDMIDLHDELARQLFYKNIQLASDVVIHASDSNESMDSLLLNLAEKTSTGARIVISLTGTESTRSILSRLSKLRSASLNAGVYEQLNSLVWITVSDREPFYSFATNALGTISVSNSVSLISEFKAHYDQLGLFDRSSNSSNYSSKNKWWPEYMRAIISKHAKDLEPKLSDCLGSFMFNERCRSLSLASLVQAEKFSSKNSTKTTSLKSSKLSKYLAGGWEHNGMDVINSVLAIANGLESIRQTLCPQMSSGLCDKMKILLSPQANHFQIPALSGDSEISDTQITVLPTLSELLYSELLRSTFQLADGRMFNLNDFQSNAGGQLEGKLKLYNLRYLQQNSIGFVKFGQYDFNDATLHLNTSKARQYPTENPLYQARIQFRSGLPLAEVKSTCQDESKCLMLQQVNSPANTSQTLAASRQHISEEELASKVNSLFKLDHPAMILSAVQQAEKQRQPGAPSSIIERTADSHIQTISSAATKDLFNWPASTFFQESDGKANNQGDQAISHRRPSAAAKPRQFNAIVLLPLHRSRRAEARSEPGGGDDDDKCSSRLDLEQAFQHLAALAYASSVADESGSNIDLTTTVIDYCDEIKLAKTKLRHELAKVNSENNGSNRTTLAVIDLDSKLSEEIDDEIESSSSSSFLSAADVRKQQLLHLTIDYNYKAGSRRQERRTRDSGHLHVNLLPSKFNEIQALIKVISSMPSWKMVHLIYTDHHHYRDEFVRLANEANVCVSKLIWIPALNTTDDAGKLNQLEKTKQLFADELFDYSIRSSSVAGRFGNDGSNSTRLLVVLASENDDTNRLILESATDSMLADYVWLTSHEWLRSVEKQVELQQMDQVKLPAYFLSTKLESWKSLQLQRWFSNLTPSLHKPIPTKWFDEFWQQQFNCTLPISSSSAVAAANVTSSSSTLLKRPLCKPNEHLKNFQLDQDDKIPFILQTFQAIRDTVGQLEANGKLQSDDVNHFSVDSFRANFEKLAQTGPENSPLIRLPYGFDIIHRLLPASVPTVSSVEGSIRRSNSRSLADGLNSAQALQLVKVGLWRDGKLILIQNKSPQSDQGSFEDHLHWLFNVKRQVDGQPENSTIGQQEGSFDELREVGLMSAKSLAKLSMIKSICLSKEVCNLCSVQVDQTNSYIRHEEFLLKQSKSISEPKAINSIEFWLNQNQSQSPEMRHKSAFDDNLASGSINDESDLQTNNKLAAASSYLVNSTQLNKQIEANNQQDLRRSFKNTMMRQTYYSSKRSKGASNLSLISSSSTSIMILLISLFGIVFMLTNLLYLYPKMLAKKERFRRRQLADADLISNYSTNTALNYKDYYLNIDYFCNDNDESMTNIHDYFLMIGLLMLFLINTAYLLPAATMTVCWFRRIGLTTTYTIIFSSILIKILSITSLLNKFRKTSAKSIAKASSFEKQQVEPIEESVEVTFESLDYDQMNTISNTVSTDEQFNKNNRLQTTEPTNLEHLSNGYQTSSTTAAALASHNDPTAACSRGTDIDRNDSKIKIRDKQNSNINLLNILILSILLEVIISLIWFVQQPPEPTLYFNCWYCSSPRKSPILFRYELLISLAYPGFILVISWFYSIYSYNLALNEEKKLFKSSQLFTNHPNQLSLNFKLKDSKSLVITTTLLIIIWSLFTLIMISNDNHQQNLSATPIESIVQLYEYDFNPIYANILSGAIIFSFLFLYNLPLIENVRCLPLCCCFKSSKAFSKHRSMIMNRTSSTSSLTSTNNNHRVLTFNQVTNSANNNNNMWFDNTHQMRQFNTYGTYNEHPGMVNNKKQTSSSSATSSFGP